MAMHMHRTGSDQVDGCMCGTLDMFWCPDHISACCASLPTSPAPPTCTSTHSSTPCWHTPPPPTCVHTCVLPHTRVQPLYHSHICTQLYRYILFIVHTDCLSVIIICNYISESIDRIIKQEKYMYIFLEIKAFSMDPGIRAEWSGGALVLLGWEFAECCILKESCRLTTTTSS